MKLARIEIHNQEPLPKSHIAVGAISEAVSTSCTCFIFSLLRRSILFKSNFLNPAYIYNIIVKKFQIYINEKNQNK
jgi:hypothetical protein